MSKRISVGNSGTGVRARSWAFTEPLDAAALAHLRAAVMRLLVLAAGRARP